MIKKVYQRLTDPLFYRKRALQVTRPFRKKSIEQMVLKSIHDFSPNRVLLAIAHPDDEVFCSGLLCEFGSRGAEIKIACLTKGEGGPLVDGMTRQDLPLEREKEMHAACEVLGVSQLTFLDAIDPVGAEFRTYAPDISIAELSNRLSSLLENVDLVITHGSGGEYWHPAHILMHRAVKLSIKGGDKKLLTFNASNAEHPIPSIINHDDPTSLRIDGSDHHDLRLRALECHQSQLGVFANFAEGSHADFVSKTAIESLRQVC